MKSVEEQGTFNLVHISNIKTSDPLKGSGDKNSLRGLTSISHRRQTKTIIRLTKHSVRTLSGGGEKKND